MKLQINLPAYPTAVDLDDLVVRNSGIINIGRQSEEVWNTLPLATEDADPFQCSIVGAVGGVWRLKDGQHRTECPKGLLSPKIVPCNSCMGRCVGLRPGKARYSQRTPAQPTLLNGLPLSEWGNEIAAGDVITFGSVVMKVVD